MRAALFQRHGPPEAIEVGELPTPEPGPGEVRVRVGASSLNHLDLWVRSGLPGLTLALPHVGGSDIAGEVDALGPGAEGVEPGDRVVVDPSLGWRWHEGVRGSESPAGAHFRVIGEHVRGGLAEYAVVPIENLLPLPDGVTFRKAAAASLVAVTAWRGLITRGGLRAGERVLITGGSGGVATMALQIALLAGAHVTVLTSGEENRQKLDALGAHQVVDRHAGEVGELLREALRPLGGVDVVFDSVGEAIWPALIRSLAPGGRLVCYGSTSGPHASIDLRHVFWKQLAVIGTTMGSPAEFRDAMRLVFDGALDPMIHSVTGLEGVQEGHRLLEDGQVFGKLVVEPGA